MSRSRKTRTAAVATTPTVEIVATPAVAINTTQSTTRQSAKLIDTLTSEQLRTQIDTLLTRLHASTDANDKKRIRRALRLRNHYQSRVIRNVAATTVPTNA